MAGLGIGSPISGRKREAPETWCAPCEFHGNLSGSRQFLPHIDHVALLLFPTSCALDEEPLLGCYHLR